MDSPVKRESGARRTNENREANCHRIRHRAPNPLGRTNPAGHRRLPAAAARRLVRLDREVDQYRVPRRQENGRQHHNGQGERGWLARLVPGREKQGLIRY